MAIFSKLRESMGWKSPEEFSPDKKQELKELLLPKTAIKPEDYKTVSEESPLNKLIGMLNLPEEWKQSKGEYNQAVADLPMNAGTIGGKVKVKDSTRYSDDLFGKIKKEDSTLYSDKPEGEVKLEETVDDMMIKLQEVPEFMQKVETLPNLIPNLKKSKEVLKKIYDYFMDLQQKKLASQEKTS